MINDYQPTLISIDELYFGTNQSNCEIPGQLNSYGLSSLGGNIDLITLPLPPLHW